jgi:hypothetical protein
MCQQQSQDKKEDYRCEHHARNSCVWRRKTDNPTKSSTIVKKIEHIVRDAVQKSAVSHATASHPTRCLSVGIAAALSVRCPVEAIIETIAPFACIRDTSMIDNRAIE